MKINNPYYTLKTAALALLTVSLFGCGGSVSAPARKKMPEFNSLDGIEGGFGVAADRPAQGSFAFAPTNVDMLFDGSSKGFVSISLPNTANDSAAISLINAVKPFVTPMIGAWAAQRRNGVMIDLASHAGGSIHRTDYLMEKPNEYSIPVIILWDAASAYRVATIKSMVDDIPPFKLSRTLGDDPLRNISGR